MSDSRNTPNRHDGWTGARRRDFIEALSSTGHVGKACAAVGLSRNAAYLLRVRDPDFAARWDAAHRHAQAAAHHKREALSGRGRRAASPLRHLRYLDKLWASPDSPTAARSRPA